MVWNSSRCSPSLWRMSFAKLVWGAVGAALAHAYAAILPAMLMVVAIAMTVLACLFLLTVRQLLFGRSGTAARRLERLIRVFREGPPPTRRPPSRRAELPRRR